MESWGLCGRLRHHSRQEMSTSMIQRHWWVVFVLAACANPEVSLDQETAAIEADRVFLKNNPITLAGAHPLTLPDSISSFDMTRPVRISFAGPPTCKLAVADMLDRAVHLFDQTGAYEATIYGGGRDTSRLASIGDMVLSPEGHVVVTNPLNDIRVFYADGSFSKFTIEKPDPDIMSFSSLAVLGDTVFDHWMLGAGKRKDYSQLPPETPSILSYSIDGRSGRTFGEIKTYPGRILNVMMNQGTLAAGLDTVWLGRRVDATLFGHPVGGGPARVLRLPLVHKMRTIRESPIPNAGNLTEAIVEYHLHDLVVDGAGNFFALQALSWPREEGALFRPDLGLAIYSADGTPLGLFDTRAGEIRAVAVGDKYVFVLVHDLEAQRSEVQRYPNPITASWGCP